MMMIMLMYVIPPILLVLLIATWIPWRDLFEKIYGNNPLRAKVYVEAGEQITICKGKYYTDTPKGLIYRYTYMEQKLSVIVKITYPYRYILGCRQIRVMAGRGTASPLGDMTTAECVVTGTTLNAILEAHIGKELVTTIFGKAVNYMVIIIMVAAIGLIGYFLFKQFLAPGDLQPPADVQQLTPEQLDELAGRR